MTTVNTINFGSQSTTVPSISSSAMLVELNISVWTGRKFDKGVSKEIDAQKHTTTRAGNYSKKLFADEPIFDAIQKFAGNARTYHYHATMPWSDSGLRLLTTPMYFDYNKEITGMQMEYDKLVDAFMSSYDKSVIQAQMKLGSLFDPNDYPDAVSVHNKYKFSVRYSPVPDTGDWRIDVGNEALSILQTNYAESYKANLEQAMREPWERMHEALQRMSEKLSGSSKQIFRDTLVTNVVEMCDLLEKFNITGDPTMKRAKQKIEDALTGITPDALREDDYLRLDVKSKVDGLLREFQW